MLLYKTSDGPRVFSQDKWYSVERAWIDLANDDHLAKTLAALVAETNPLERSPLERSTLLAPIADGQELWAAGVTYLRSRTARMEESQSAGGGDFYDRVYSAERPEIFFKATPHRIVGPSGTLHLRRDAKWIVPEPELTLVVTRKARVIGYTIGNDLSCRDIEGENPLYLPQAKTFDRCAALGPAILVSDAPPASDTSISINIRRSGATVFQGATTLGRMKRTLDELVHFLFRDNAHPKGCLLMTGTGVVPPDEFTLQARDRVEIAIDGIGTLVNEMD